MAAWQPHTGIISHINFERASNARIVSGINENIKYWQGRGRFLTQHTRQWQWCCCVRQVVIFVPGTDWHRININQRSVSVVLTPDCSPPSHFNLSLHFHHSPSSWWLLNTDFNEIYQNKGDFRTHMSTTYFVCLLEIFLVWRKYLQTRDTHDHAWTFTNIQKIIITT